MRAAIPEVAGPSLLVPQPHAPDHDGQFSRLSASSTASSSGPLSAEENEFIATLNEDLDSFNAFFIEKEEDAVIKIHVCVRGWDKGAGRQWWQLS